VVGIRDDLAEQGYFELPAALPAELIARAREDVERRAAAAEAFLDDAMWEILDAVVPVARDALAHDVAILPAFWAWNVAATEHGWPPHRDHAATARDDHGALAAITIWVPLTDATTRNGCIHCVPAYWDYGYHNPKASPVISQTQCIRALPVAAGSILGWSHALLHWGGACAPDAAARISTSFELIRSDLIATVPRTFPVGWRPNGAERAALLEEMREKYSHML
jgi:ectoine hydroxylase-related dioxygenase (phytanoyl-CoA dioxygenase family)